MTSIGTLIEVFRIDEISKSARVELIIKLGDAINYEHGANLTEPVVFELVSILDPENKILKDEDFIKRLNY